MCRNPLSVQLLIGYSCVFWFQIISLPTVHKTTRRCHWTKRLIKHSPMRLRMHEQNYTNNYKVDIAVGTFINVDYVAVFY